MIRTQIYLTETQRTELAAISKISGKKQSQLIREAVDQFIETTGQDRRAVVLTSAAGIWKNRNDLPDFETLRRDWDRR